MLQHQANKRMQILNMLYIKINCRLNMMFTTIKIWGFIKTYDKTVVKTLWLKCKSTSVSTVCWLSPVFIFDANFTLEVKQLWKILTSISLSSSDWPQVSRSSRAWHQKLSSGSNRMPSGCWPINLPHKNRHTNKTSFHTHFVGFSLLLSTTKGENHAKQDKHI